MHPDSTSACSEELMDLQLLALAIGDLGCWNVTWKIKPYPCSWAFSSSWAVHHPYTSTRCCGKPFLTTCQRQQSDDLRYIARVLQLHGIVSVSQGCGKQLHDLST